MRDKVILYITGFVGLFIVLSLTAQFILVLTDQIEGDEGVWRPLFDLVAILVGAVAGYVGGVTVERDRRRNNGNNDKE